MRHRYQNQLYGYKQGPRKALTLSLINALVEHERIRTTLVKAKYIKSHVEKAVTQAKKQTLHSRRTLLSRIPNKKTVSLLLTKVSPRFINRPGGYTRIIKTAPRMGDGAPMAYLEFVDYQPPSSHDSSKKGTEKKDSSQQPSAKKPEKKDHPSVKLPPKKDSQQQEASLKNQPKIPPKTRKDHHRQKV